MKKYFYSEGTIKHGPYTLSELQEKGITADTLIWYDGLEQWTAAGELEELTELLSSTPPPVPEGIAQPQTTTAPRRPQQIPEEEKPRPRPKNWLVESILATLFCCMPFGIAGIVYAAKVDSLYNRGDYRGADFASADAKKWTMVSFWIGIAVGVIYFFIGVLGGMA
ncbi:MAG: hypothetical protein Roseis2KO_50970 [Roseivirga sp.]